MIRKLMSLAALAAVVLVAGCGGSGSDDVGGFSFVRLINAAPDTFPDVYFREELVEDNLAYDDAIPSDGSAPETTDSGTALFEFETSGEDATTVSRTVNLESNYVYTAIFAGFVGNTGVNAPRVIISSDRTEDLESGAANVRFVNAAPVIDTAVDIYVIDPEDDFTNENPSLTNVSRYGVSNLLRVSPGTYRVVITETGTDNVVFNATRNLLTDTYSTFVAMNTNDNEEVQLRAYGAAF
jgi:hypothetical protein